MEVRTLNVVRTAETHVRAVNRTGKRAIQRFAVMDARKLWTLLLDFYSVGAGAGN